MLQGVIFTLWNSVNTGVMDIFYTIVEPSKNKIAGWKIFLQRDNDTETLYVPFFNEKFAQYLLRITRGTPWKTTK